MKSGIRHSELNRKKNMNLTAQVSDVLRAFNKQPTWKSKTNKLTKTAGGKTITQPTNIMTEDDIDRLFKNESKQKQKDQKQVKAQTEGIEKWEVNKYKDFVNSVKFLKVEDKNDRLLTGILSEVNDEIKIGALFDEDQKYDLTTKFKKDFQVGKVIGEGAYASVRIAIHRQLNKTVAIKIYEKNKIKDPQRKKSIRREIIILQMLRHPNIVDIIDVVETNNHLNIVMEYLDGISLGSYLKSHGNKISEKICKRIFRQLTKALKYMHSMKIAHRDIKLENIILDESLSPKFIDFGFSTCIEANKRIKIFCGTPSYMAPEVVQRKQYRGETADIWALGVLLYVSMTGIFPFKGSTDQQLYSKINNADYQKEQLMFSRYGSDLISRMLTIDPEQRITASQMLSHSWFTSQSKIDLKKQPFQLKNERKRINTVESQREKQRIWANKTSKKVLAETCKDNLQFQIKMALKSPSNTAYKQINSHRKVEYNKENVLKGLKSGTLKTQKPTNISNKQLKCKNNKIKPKACTLRNSSKLIDLLRLQISKGELEKSKSKTKKI